jgi:hypothetical protein
MKCTGNAERYRFNGAVFFGQFSGSLTGADSPAKDDLTGAIKVNRDQQFALRGLFAPAVRPERPLRKAR